VVLRSQKITFFFAAAKKKKPFIFLHMQKNERFLLNHHADYFNYPAYPAAEGDPAYPVISLPAHKITYLCVLCDLCGEKKGITVQV
jgi:hypothetical protein